MRLALNKSHAGENWDILCTQLTWKAAFRQKGGANVKQIAKSGWDICTLWDFSGPPTAMFSHQDDYFTLVGLQQVSC